MGALFGLLLVFGAIIFIHMVFNLNHNGPHDARNNARNDPIIDEHREYAIRRHALQEKINQWKRECGGRLPAFVLANKRYRELAMAHGIDIDTPILPWR